MELLQITAVALMIALVLSLTVFRPLFGIKFTKFAFPLALLYSLTSGIAALVGAFVGSAFLIMGFWVAIGGGAAMWLLYCACLLPFALAVLANFSVLAGLQKICPNCYEQRSTLSALMAAAIVVLCQVGGVYFVKTNVRHGHDGLVKFDVPLWQKEIRPLFGYIDKSGKFVIKPQFAEAEKFHGGKAVVWPEGAEPTFKNDDLALETYPLIDKTGNISGSISESEHAKLRDAQRYENPEDYDESHHGSSSFAILARKSGWQEGEGNFSDIADRLYEGLATKAKDNNYVYVDKYGKVIIDRNFFDAQRFSEGLAAVEVRANGKIKWGYITRDGAWAIRPCFDKASPFHEGLAAVGFINEAPDAKYQSLNCNAYRFGYIDKGGKFVIPPIFLHAYSFSEGLAAARIDVSYPVKEEEGRRLVESLVEQQKADDEKRKKDLEKYIALCLKSWRDAPAWGESADQSKLWLDNLTEMESSGEKPDKIMASKAVIYTIAYPVNIKEAEKLAQKAIALNDKNALARGVLAHCLALRGQNNSAIKEFALAQKLAPSVEWLAQTGLTYEDMDKLDLAIAEYSKMIEATPRDPWAYGSRSHAYLSKMQFKQGLADAQLALHIDPQNVFALKQLASVATYNHQFEKAIGYLKTAEEALDPKSMEQVEVLDMRAKAEEGLGHKKEAENLRKRVKALISS